MKDYHELINKANILVEGLPYINRLAKKTVVIKYGGNAMSDDGIFNTIMQDVATLKIVGVHPILVHGGGPEINAMLDRLGIKSEFIGGLRVTTKEAMDVVQMVLGGKINKNITASLSTLNVKAIGLCGKDANLIRADKMPPINGVDYGYVGVVKQINTELLQMLCEDEFIPVISSIGVGADGESYNINADTVASEIAMAMKAEKLITLTNVDGVRSVENDPSTLISIITVKEIDAMIKKGLITGGMIPKLNGCAACIAKGVKNVHLINGTLPHPILLEVFTDEGIGTMITE